MKAVCLPLISQAGGHTLVRLLAATLHIYFNIQSQANELAWVLGHAPLKWPVKCDSPQPLYGPYAYVTGSIPSRLDYFVLGRT